MKSIKCKPEIKKKTSLQLTYALNLDLILCCSFTHYMIRHKTTYVVCFRCLAVDFVIINNNNI